MKDTNIVKLDRTTVQEFLPMLTHRGVFSNYENLPKRDEILQAEKNRLKVDNLTLEQERNVLSKVGKYRSNAYVIRDYGDYVIAFSAKMYLENLTKTEEELKDELMLERYGKEKINEALKKISTYKLAHKIAIIILGEVYKQQKHEGLILSKSEIVKALGYESANKYIYEDIRDAMQSLRWLDYLVYNYKTKKKLKQESKTTGNFIYNLSESSAEFKVWVNPLFVGCAIHMANDGTSLSKEERQTLFARGYLNYPLSYIADSKNASPASYYLGHFLITQLGNMKLNTKESKIIAVSFDKLIEESKIEETRPDRKVKKLLDALEEIAYVQQIKPTISELRKMKPKVVEKKTVHIYLLQQEKYS